MENRNKDDSKDISVTHNEAKIEWAPERKKKVCRRQE